MICKCGNHHNKLFRSCESCRKDISPYCFLAFCFNSKKEPYGEYALCFFHHLKLQGSNIHMAADWASKVYEEK